MDISWVEAPSFTDPSRNKLITDMSLSEAVKHFPLPIHRRETHQRGDQA